MTKEEALQKANSFKKHLENMQKTIEANNAALSKGFSELIKMVGNTAEVKDVHGKTGGEPKPTDLKEVGTESKHEPGFEMALKSAVDEMRKASEESTLNMFKMFFGEEEFNEAMKAVSSAGGPQSSAVAQFVNSPNVQPLNATGVGDRTQVQQPIVRAVVPVLKSDEGKPVANSISGFSATPNTTPQTVNLSPAMAKSALEGGSLEDKLAFMKGAPRTTEIPATLVEVMGKVGR